MEWAEEILRWVGVALVLLGGWSATDSLRRIAQALEGRRSDPTA